MGEELRLRLISIVNETADLRDIRNALIIGTGNGMAATILMELAGHSPEEPIFRGLVALMMLMGASLGLKWRLEMEQSGLTAEKKAAVIAQADAITETEKSEQN